MDTQAERYGTPANFRSCSPLVLLQEERGERVRRCARSRGIRGDQRGAEDPSLLPANERKARRIRWTPASSFGGLGHGLARVLGGKDAAGSGVYIGAAGDRIPYESERIWTPISIPKSALRSVRGRR